MSGFRIDLQPPWVQRAFSLLPGVVPYALARRLSQRLAPADAPRDAYLAAMSLEVLWLNRWHLRHCFEHAGVGHLDPRETYVFTSLHFGHWGMYPASLYQQHGIASQMVATGRNQDRTTPRGHFWYRYGHLRQHLSGYPCCYSTDGVFAHLRRLRSGRSLTVVADVREQGLPQTEVAVDFLGGPFYLQRAVPLLARRAGVRIVPYIGYYDAAAARHRVTWFPPLRPSHDDGETLQALAALWEPVVRGRESCYFNVLKGRRRACPAQSGSGAKRTG
jgi:lauroyl/myristoyl acyltransferase